MQLNDKLLSLSLAKKIGRIITRNCALHLTSINKMRVLTNLVLSGYGGASLPPGQNESLKLAM